MQPANAIFRFFNSKKILLILLQISCFAVFIGRAWEHVRWDPPYRALLWDQHLLEGFITRFTNLSWTEYATSPVVDDLIQHFIIGTGYFYILCALAALTVNMNHAFIRQLSKGILLTGFLGLLFLAFLYYKEVFLDIGQFFEYSSQFTAPLLLLIVLSPFRKKQFQVLLKIIIALTFICHGLYAIGYYPTPGNWVDMIIMTLNVSDHQAGNLLYMLGILDIVFSILIFVPGFVKPALFYFFSWGFITTMARIYANLYIGSAWVILELFLHEVLVRVPHFLFPLLLLFLLRKNWKYELKFT